MTADLTLPGELPGLLRLGSVGAVRHLTDGPKTYGAGRCVVLRPEPDGYGDILAALEDNGWRNEHEMALADVALADVLLDLTDPTGRAHACWWLMAQRFPRVGPGCGMLWHYNGHAGLWRVVDRMTELCAGPTGRAGLGPVDRWGAYRSGGWIVPALADLDPDDSSTLDDGSRWVDAEALRLVCLHVAGRL